MLPEARREQILSEATRLIARSGYNSLTLAGVASACGIRKQAVLHYFASMTDLLQAVLERRDRVVFEEAVQSQFPQPNPQSCRDSFSRVADQHWRHGELTRLAKVVGAEALDEAHPAHEWMLRTHEATLEALTTALAWKPDPAIAAVQLLSFWEGLELLSTRDSNIDARRAWNSFCDDFFPHTHPTTDP